MLRVSEAAALALHTMVILAADSDRVVSTNELATQLHASRDHLSKVLQRLGKVGLVRSIRGPRGGFLLGKSGDKITLLEIYESIDGSLKSGACLFGTPVCGNKKCFMGDFLVNLKREVRNYFAQTKLSQLTNSPGEKIW